MCALKIGFSSVFAIIVFAQMSYAWVRFREPLSRRNFLNQTLIEKLQNCAGKEEHECGLCGEGPGEIQTHGIPTENYTVIDPDVRVLAVELGFRSGLNGYLEFRVCNVTDNSTLDAVTCNAITPLLIGSDEQWYPSQDQTSAKSRFRLPRGLFCERCVLQVKYTPGPNSTMKDFRFYDCALLNITHPTKVLTNTVITTRTITNKKVFPHDLQISESRRGSTELRSANTHQTNNQNVLRSTNKTVTISLNRRRNNQLNAGLDNNSRNVVHPVNTFISSNADRQDSNQLNMKNNQDGMRSVSTAVNTDANRQNDTQLNLDNNKEVVVSLHKAIDIGVNSQGNNQIDVNDNQGVMRSVSTYLDIDVVGQGNNQVNSDGNQGVMHTAIDIDVTRERSNQLNLDGNQGATRSVNTVVNIDTNRQGNNQMNVDNNQSLMRSVNTVVNIDANRQGNNEMNVDNNQSVMRSVNTAVNIDTTRRGMNVDNNQRFMNSSINIVRTVNTRRNANQGRQEINALNSETLLTGTAGVSEGDNAKTVLISTKFYNLSTSDSNAAAVEPELARITTIDIKGRTTGASGNNKMVSDRLSQANSSVNNVATKSDSSLFSNMKNESALSNTASSVVSTATNDLEKHSFKIHGVNLDKKKMDKVLNDNTNALSETTNIANKDFVNTNTNLISETEIANTVKRVGTANLQNNDTVVTDVSNGIQGEITTGTKETTNNNESLGYYDYAYYYFNDTSSGNDTYIYYEDTVNTYNDTQVIDAANLSESEINSSNSIDVTRELNTIVDRTNNTNSQISDKDVLVRTEVSSGVRNVDITNSINDLSNQVHQDSQIVQNVEASKNIINELDRSVVNTETTLEVDNRINELDVNRVSGSQFSTIVSTTTLYVEKQPLNNITFESRGSSGFAHEIANMNTNTDTQNVNQTIVLVPNTIIVLPERNDTNQYAVDDRSRQTFETMDALNTSQDTIDISQRSGQSNVNNTNQSGVSAQTNTVNESRISAFDKSIGWNNVLLDESRILRQDNSLNEVSVNNAVSSGSNVVSANSVVDSTSNIYPYDINTDMSFNEATKKLVYAISAADRKPQYALANEIKSSDINNENNVVSSSSMDTSLLNTNTAQFENQGWNRIEIISNKTDISAVADKSKSLTMTGSNTASGVGNIDITNSIYDLSAFPERNNENIRGITNVETSNDIIRTDMFRNNQLINNENLINPLISTSRNTVNNNNDLSTQTQSESKSNININLDSHSKTDTFDVSGSTTRLQTRSGIERSAFPGRVFAKIPDLITARTMEKVTTPRQIDIIENNEIIIQNDNSQSIMESSLSGTTSLENNTFTVFDKMSTQVSNKITDSATDTIATTSSPNVQLDISTRPYDNYLGVLSTTTDPFEKSGSTFVRMVNYSEITSDSVFPAPKLDVSSISDIIGDKQTNTESVLASMFISTPLPEIILGKTSGASPDVTNAITSGFETMPSFTNLNFFADSKTRVDHLGGVPILTSQDDKGTSSQTQSSSVSRFFTVNDVASGIRSFDTTNTLGQGNNLLNNKYHNVNSNSRIIGLAVPLENSKLDSETQVVNMTSRLDNSVVRTSNTNVKPNDKVSYQGGKTIVWQSMQLSNISNLNNNVDVSNNVNLIRGSGVVNNDSSDTMTSSTNIDSQRINSNQNETAGSASFVSTNTFYTQRTYPSNGSVIATATVRNAPMNVGDLKEKRNLHISVNRNLDIAPWEHGSSKILNARIGNNEYVSKSTNFTDKFIADNTNTNIVTISNPNIVSTSTEILPRVVSSSTSGDRLIVPSDTFVMSERNAVIDNSELVGITTTNAADTNLVTTIEQNVQSESMNAPLNKLDITMNGNARINKIKNTEQGMLTIVNNKRASIERNLKSTKVDDMGISINGNANKNNILAAKDLKLRTEIVRENAPVVMPPIEVKSSVKRVIDRVTYLTGQDRNKLSTRQNSLTPPRRNITLFNPYLKANDYNLNVQNRQISDSNRNVGNSVYNIILGKSETETSKSNLSMSTLWDINRGNNDGDKETVVNRNTIQLNNVNTDVYRGIGDERQNNQQTFDNSPIIYSSNDIQAKTVNVNNQNDVNQNVLRTLEALFLELGAIDSKNGQANTETMPVYKEKSRGSLRGSLRGSYPLFQVHENLLTVPTVIREWNSNPQLNGGQRGSQNHRLLNNVAVTNQRDWNNAFKLNTNINVENSSAVRNSGQSVIDMSNLQGGSSNLFSRLSGSFANISRLGRRDLNSTKEIQNSKLIKAISTQGDIAGREIINDITSVQDSENIQVVKPIVRKQAIINSQGSTFFNPFTGENITLPGRGKHFSDTFIARGIGNLQHIKGIEQFYPANFSGRHTTNQMYTYTPGSDSGNKISIEGKYMQGQMKVNEMGQFEPVPLASRFNTDVAENRTVNQYTNDADANSNNVDLHNMSLKASILSRLFSRNSNNANITTNEALDIPSSVLTSLLKSDKTNIAGTTRSASSDSTQISNEGILTGNADQVNTPLAGISNVNTELLKESSTSNVNTEQIFETNRFPKTNELETYTINLFDVNSMKQKSKSSVINRNNNLQANILNQQNNILRAENVLSPDKYFYSQNELLNGIALNPTSMPSILTEVSPIVASNIVKESFIDTVTKCRENELFICNAVGKNRDVPGMVWWCFSHCQNGVCPPEKCACRCEKTNRLQRYDDANVREKVSGNRRRESKKVIELTLNNPEVSTTSVGSTVGSTADNFLTDSTSVPISSTSTLANNNAASRAVLKNNSDSIASVIETGNVNIVKSENTISNSTLKCKGINAFKDTTGIDELCTKMCAQNICPDKICRCS